jgi:acetolactate synthase I/III small subunit
VKKRHTLVVLVEDHPGVLNRVVSLMRRRSFNIDSITVGHSEQPGISRITLVVVGREEEIEQVGKQLYKLLEVVGSEERIDSLLAMVKGFGIRELVRTGAVAMARGAQATAIKDGRPERDAVVIASGSVAMAN